MEGTTSVYSMVYCLCKSSLEMVLSTTCWSSKVMNWHRSKFSPLLQWCCLHFSKISTIGVFNNRQTNKQSIVGEMPNQTELQQNKTKIKKKKVSMAYYISVGISLSICMCPSICLSIHACFHPI